MNTESKRPNYRIYDRTGGGVTEDIYAESLDDAIEQGREWIEDGDWSGGGDDNGERTYRKVALACAVGPIIYTPDLRSIETLPGVWGAGVLPDCPDLIIITVDNDALTTILEHRMIPGSITQTIPDNDGSTILHVTHRGIPMCIDEEATNDAERHDCSGVYNDELPECEVGSKVDADKLPDADVDSEGHEWVSTTEMGDEFGCRSHGGTAMSHYEVCRLCGQYKITQTPGCQRNPDEPLETITIRDRDEASEKWLTRIHEDNNGYIPQWLAELLGEEGNRLTRAEMAQALRDAGQEDEAVLVESGETNRGFAQSILDELAEA